MVTECIPRQLRDETMILMQIVTVMGQDQVRRKILLELLELLLDFTAHVRQKAVAEIVYDNVTPDASNKFVCTFEGFIFPLLG
jgi:hypothetical protein